MTIRDLEADGRNHCKIWMNLHEYGHNKIEFFVFASTTEALQF